MIEFSVNRSEVVDGERRGTTIGIVQVDETDPKAAPVVLQPLDGQTLAIVLKVLRDMDSAQAATRKAWA